MPDERISPLLPRIKQMRPNLPVIVHETPKHLHDRDRRPDAAPLNICPSRSTLSRNLIAIVGPPKPTQGGRQFERRGEIASIPLVVRSPAMQAIYRVLRGLMQTT